MFWRGCSKARSPLTSDLQCQLLIYKSSEVQSSTTPRSKHPPPFHKTPGLVIVSGTYAASCSVMYEPQLGPWYTNETRAHQHSIPQKKREEIWSCLGTLVAVCPQLSVCFSVPDDMVHELSLRPHFYCADINSGWLAFSTLERRLYLCEVGKGRDCLNGCCSIICEQTGSYLFEIVGRLQEPTAARMTMLPIQ